MVAPPPSPAPPKPKLGDILRDLLPKLRQGPWLGGRQRHVLYRLSRCGTDRAGLVQVECQECGHAEWRPMSCQDRHCPSCGTGRAEEWIQSRLDEVLDVPYSHLSFGLPQPLHPLCRDNPKELFGLLFAAVQQTLKAFAADSEHLGGTPAFFCVLHTATRRLNYFPHIHVGMAGATFDEDTGKLSVAPDGQPLFDTDELADAFRERFLAGLRRLYEAGKLVFSWQGTQALKDPQAFDDLVMALQEVPWKVWLQPATPGIESTIRYLGRYIQRTAITNARIQSYDGSSVTFSSQDTRTRRRHSRTVKAEDFVRLFAQHILPKGFQRVRFYGLLSPSKRKTVLPRAQAAARATAKLRGFIHAVQAALQPERPPPLCCQVCGAARMRAIAIRRGNTITILHPPTFPIPPPDAAGRSGRWAS